MAKYPPAYFNGENDPDRLEQSGDHNHPAFFNAAGTALVDPMAGKSLYTFGSNIITVGAGGQFATIEEAFTYRNTVFQPTLLTSALTCTVTGTSSGTVDVRRITFSGNVPGISSTTTQGYGVRVGGSTAPIVPIKFVSNSVATFEGPAPADITAGTACEIFLLNHATIFMLPETHLRISTTTNLTFPAYTLLTAIPGTASITKDTGATFLFIAGADFTGSAITNLKLVDDQRVTNSIFFSNGQSYGTGVNLLRPLTDFEISNCDIILSSFDFYYATGSGSCAFRFTNNRVKAVYDVVRLGTAREYLFIGNDILSTAIVDSEAGQANCINFGVSGTAFTYPKQNWLIKGNRLRAHSEPSNTDEYCRATAIDLRFAVSSQVSLVIDDNDIEVSINAASGFDTGWGAADDFCARAVSVGDAVTGTNAPNIVVTNNRINAQKYGTNTKVPLTMSSYNATYVINQANNVAVGGGTTAVGTNTAALATIVSE